MAGGRGPQAVGQHVGLDTQWASHGSGVDSCRGKGRKDRITPLINSTVATLRVWLSERAGTTGDPLFPNHGGHGLSRDAVERRLAKYATLAALDCPSLRTKRISAHVLRHTAAMQLLQAGVDTSVIALWLGHEHVATTQIYLHADLSLKERALARTTPLATKAGRFRPSDSLLAFLRNILAKLPKKDKALHQRVHAAYWSALNEVSTPNEAEQRLRSLINELEPAYPSAAACLADDLEALCVHLRYPLRLRKCLRSSNLLERSLGEVQRRVKVIGRFPGETSCLSLSWAVLDLVVGGAHGLGLTVFDHQHIENLRLLRQPAASLRETA